MEENSNLIQKKNGRKRRRRETTDDVEWTIARVPNTKWCGRGNSAATQFQLGSYATADRCCRQHDLTCPHHIAAWEEKFDLFNQRPYTAMHCTCDDRWVSSAFDYGISRLFSYGLSIFEGNMQLTRVLYNYLPLDSDCFEWTTRSGLNLLVPHTSIHPDFNFKKLK